MCFAQNSSCDVFNYQVGDNQCLLQSLKDSPYYRLFEDKAGIWEQRLADLDEICHNLNQIQRKWGLSRTHIWPRGATEGAGSF